MSVKSRTHQDRGEGFGKSCPWRVAGGCDEGSRITPQRKVKVMQETLTIRIFDWDGRWHVVCDVVYPAPRNRVARRRPVWRRSYEVGMALSPAHAMSLAAMALLAGPTGLTPLSGAPAPSAPLEGPRGDEDTPEAVPRRADGSRYPARTAPPAIDTVRGVPRSDGLWPPGVQPALSAELDRAWEAIRDE